MLEKIIRLLKALDAFVMDLLFPNVPEEYRDDEDGPGKWI